MDLSRTWRDQRQRAWMSLARQGHERAFRRLYGELYPPVMAFVRGRIRPEEAAEDVVSGVFHRWLTNLDRYDPDKGSVWSWTFALARNACIDHLRRQRPAESLESHVDTLATGRVDPLGHLVQEEEDRLLHGLLRHESPQLREMFALHFRDGLNYAEIATVLDLSEAAVKQRFARAQRRLRAEGKDRRKGDEHEPIAFDARTAEDPA